MVDFALNGLVIKRCAVALLARRIGRDGALIFFKALANPSGYRVRRAPEASARNSRLRDMASRISVAVTGVKIAKIRPIISKIAPPLLSLLRLLPHLCERRKRSESIVTKPAITTITVERSMSRLPI